MSSSFTVPQLEEINRLLEDNKNNTAVAIGGQVEAAIKAQQETVIASAHSAITAAINANRAAFIATFESDPTKPTPPPKSKKWEAFLALLPGISTAIVTAIFGLVIWHQQTQILTKIDENKVVLTSRLSLKEEFFKRKLTVYADTHSQLAALIAALNILADDKTQGGAAVDAIGGFNDFLAKSKLFISDKTYAELDKLREHGLETIQNKDHLAPNDLKKRVSDFEKMLKEVEKTLATDLDVQDLGSILKVLKESK